MKGYAGRAAGMRRSLHLSQRQLLTAGMEPFWSLMLTLKFLNRATPGAIGRPAPYRQPRTRGSAPPVHFFFRTGLRLALIVSSLR